MKSRHFIVGSSGLSDTFGGVDGYGRDFVEYVAGRINLTPVFETGREASEAAPPPGCGDFDRGTVIEFSRKRK